jgi:hypothetical protein
MLLFSSSWQDFSRYHKKSIETKSFSMDSQHTPLTLSTVWKNYLQNDRADRAVYPKKINIQSQCDSQPHASIHPTAHHAHLWLKNIYVSAS